MCTCSIYPHGYQGQSKGMLFSLLKGIPARSSLPLAELRFICSNPSLELSDTSKKTLLIYPRPKKHGGSMHYFILNIAEHHFRTSDKYAQIRKSES